jgi:hypothetical protein
MGGGGRTAGLLHGEEGVSASIPEEDFKEDLL